VEPGEAGYWPWDFLIRALDGQPLPEVIVVYTHLKNPSQSGMTAGPMGWNMETTYDLRRTHSQVAMLEEAEGHNTGGGLNG